MKRSTAKTLTTRTDTRWCPNCFQLLTAVMSMLGEHRAGPGDFTVCITCASVLRFTETMDYELASLEAIPTHSRMMFARAVQAVKSRASDRPLRIT